MRRPSLAVAALACALTGTIAAAGCGSDDAKRPATQATDPAGKVDALDLVRLANRYYAEAARLTVVITSAERAGAFSVRYDLDHGVARASVTEFGSGEQRTTTVTAAAGSFRRVGTARCWIHAEQPDPLPTTPFGILTRGLRASAPRPAGALVRVNLVRRDPDTGQVTRGWATIDPDTGRIGTIADGDLVTAVETLEDPPALPATTPLCPESSGG